MNMRPHFKIVRLSLIALACAALLGGFRAPAQAPPAGTAPPPAATAPATPAPATTSSMPPVTKPAQQDAFYVVGVSVRTSNDEVAKDGGPIPGLWQNFMEQNLGSTIPDRVGDDIYVVYTDFDQGLPGAYTYVLGGKVSSIAHVPAGMVSRQVPAGRYVVVTSDKGPLQQVVPAVWAKIWTMTPDQLGGTRAHGADYEIYNLESFNPQDSQVNVYLGVK